MKQKTLLGRDEQILDPACLELTHPQEEAAFQDWLQRHGYSSKEEYYAECHTLEVSEIIDI